MRKNSEDNMSLTGSLINWAFSTEVNENLIYNTHIPFPSVL
jgi:hypothetical protein